MAEKVSIPLRSDFNIDTEKLKLFGSEVSIPLRSDFNACPAVIMGKPR